MRLNALEIQFVENNIFLLNNNNNRKNVKDVHPGYN